MKKSILLFAGLLGGIIMSQDSFAQTQGRISPASGTAPVVTPAKASTDQKTTAPTNTAAKPAPAASQPAPVTRASATAPATKQANTPAEQAAPAQRTQRPASGAKTSGSASDKGKMVPRAATNTAK